MQIFSNVMFVNIIFYINEPKGMIVLALLTFLPFQDAYISEWYAEQNFGSSTALFVGRYMQPGDVYRSLIQFNLNSIPPASTIETAELKLTMFRNEINNDGVYIRVHRLLNNWDQFTVTWNTQPPFSPTPFSPMWDSAEYISSSTELGLLTIDITDLVKGWIDGSIPNNGILLAGNEMVNDLMAFRSTNYLNSNEQPMLAIKYVEGILETYETQEITIPTNTDNPIAESDPITLGPREKATFMVWNTSDSANVSVKVQVGFENSPDQVFFDAGHWFNLEPEGYPGEALALSTTDAANYARVLVRGEGGETVIVYPLTKEV